MLSAPGAPRPPWPTAQHCTRHTPRLTKEVPREVIPLAARFPYQQPEPPRAVGTRAELCQIKHLPSGSTQPSPSGVGCPSPSSQLSHSGRADKALLCLPLFSQEPLLTPAILGRHLHHTPAFPKETLAAARPRSLEMLSTGRQRRHCRECSQAEEAWKVIQELSSALVI